MPFVATATSGLLVVLGAARDGPVRMNDKRARTDGHIATVASSALLRFAETRRALDDGRGEMNESRLKDPRRPLSPLRTLKRSPLGV
jgi:hypothetical protein